MASEKRPNLGKVLVTGGCGFLGHHVVRLLLRDYRAETTVVDLRCSRNRRPDSDGVAYHEADITDAARMASLFAEVRPDVVIHTAAPVPHTTTHVSDAMYKKVNVDGTQMVVDACRANRVKALVYTSSASVLSDNKTDLINADERWPVIRGKDQTEYYSETKVQGPSLHPPIHAAADKKTMLTSSPGSGRRRRDRSPSKQQQARRRPVPDVLHTAVGYHGRGRPDAAVPHD